MGEALELERGAPPPPEGEGKKKRKRKTLKVAETEMDITSLIDVVFLLVLFYMVITELSSAEIEEVTLPKAVMGVDDKPIPPNRIIINIREDGEIWVHKRRHRLTQLRARLHAATASFGVDEYGLPTVAIKIRADQDTDFWNVQKVMEQCALEFIWQISFGCQPKETGVR